MKHVEEQMLVAYTLQSHGFRVDGGFEDRVSVLENRFRTLCALPKY